MNYFKAWYFPIILLVLYFLDLFLFYICFHNSYPSLELIVNICGGFVATVLGVFLSLYFTNKKLAEDKAQETHEILLGSIKLIYSEIDLNIMILESIKNALEEMPNEVNEFYDNFSFLELALLRLKNQAFYGIIASGEMKSLTRKPSIFNPIQQAYFNIELSTVGFTTTKVFFKDFKGKKLTSVEIQKGLDHLNLLKQNLDILIKILKRANEVSKEYLEKNGTNIYIDKAIQYIRNELQSPTKSLPNPV